MIETASLEFIRGRDTIEILILWVTQALDRIEIVLLELTRCRDGKATEANSPNRMQSQELQRRTMEGRVGSGQDLIYSVHSGL